VQNRGVRLSEIIHELESFDKEDTIYASEPWTEDSDALVSPVASSNGPSDLSKRNLSYFLEIFVAREVLDGWTASLGSEPTLQQKCARLIQYARNDA